MSEQRKHLRTIRAVARDNTGVPNARDADLQAADDAGLIRFRAWPSGHWQLTEAGRELLMSEATS